MCLQEDFSLQGVQIRLTSSATRSVLKDDLHLFLAKSLASSANDKDFDVILSFMFQFYDTDKDSKLSFQELS